VHSIIALILLGGPFKSYEAIAEGLISQLAGWAILYLIFGLRLVLPSRRLARFAAKISEMPAEVPSS
jgi:hypothetical protein